MAKEVVLRDDLDGSYDDVQTVTLTWGERAVEIDLSEANRKVLDDLLAPYLEAGRRARRPSASPRRGRGPRPSKAEQDKRAAVRAWAATQGIEVSARGPIPEHVMAQYDSREE